MPFGLEFSFVVWLLLYFEYYMDFIESHYNIIQVSFDADAAAAADVVQSFSTFTMKTI